MKTAQIEALNENYFSGRQDINFRGLYQLDDHRLRINIKVDSYDFQCSARISIWSKEELKWNHLASIPYSEMSTVKNQVFAYRKPVDLLNREKAAFQDDKEELLDKAEMILL